jgi:Holliday junction resolvase
MRKKTRVDLNHKEIVAALRDVGASVYSLSTVGGGVPDLLVGFRGVNYLIEIKSKYGTFTPDQTEFYALYRGAFVVVRSVSEAYAAIGVKENQQ